MQVSNSLSVVKKSDRLSHGPLLEVHAFSYMALLIPLCVIQQSHHLKHTGYPSQWLPLRLLHSWSSKHLTNLLDREGECEFGINNWYSLKMLYYLLNLYILLISSSGFTG